jgi:hypothetical protein
VEWPDHVLALVGSSGRFSTVFLQGFSWAVLNFHIVKNCANLFEHSIPSNDLFFHIEKFVV